MKNLPTLAVAAFALLSLAACEHKTEEVDSRAPDPMASELANAAPIEAPPSISASVTFRCQPGNTLLYVDFFKGEKMAVLKESKDASPKVLNAPEAGQPYVGDNGTSISGGPKSATIVLSDGTSHSCKS